MWTRMLQLSTQQQQQQGQWRPCSCSGSGRGAAGGAPAWSLWQKTLQTGAACDRPGWIDQDGLMYLLSALHSYDTWLEGLALSQSMP